MISSKRFFLSVLIFTNLNCGIFSAFGDLLKKYDNAITAGISGCAVGAGSFALLKQIGTENLFNCIKIENPELYKVFQEKCSAAGNFIPEPFYIYNQTGNKIDNLIFGLKVISSIGVGYLAYKKIRESLDSCDKSKLSAKPSK